MAATKVPLATQLRELLSKASKDDVDDLDAQVAAKQAELDALRADRQARKRMDDTTIAERRKKLLFWLKANGAKSINEVSTGSGMSLFGFAALGQVIAGCPWFHISPDKIVSLTDKGKRVYEDE